MPPRGFEPRSFPPQGKILSKFNYGGLINIFNKLMFKYFKKEFNALLDEVH